MLVIRGLAAKFLEAGLRRTAGGSTVHCAEHRLILLCLVTHFALLSCLTVLGFTQFEASLAPENKPLFLQRLCKVGQGTWGIFQPIFLVLILSHLAL